MAKNFSTVFVIAAIALIGFFSLNYQKKISVTTNVGENEKQEQNFDITFVIFGEMGKVVGWNTAPDLADAIIIINYKAQNKIINVVSLPRDLFVDLGGEQFKLNEVIRRNKTGEFLSKLPDISGLETSNFVVINIDIVKNVVDNLGGIDIYLKNKVVDKVSGYTMEPGQRHLNGDDAIWLVRNRFNPEGDFFREKNQYEVIQAIAAKYANLNPLEKSSFMFKMFPEIAKIKTNIDFSRLFSTFEKVNDVKFNDVVLDFSTGLLVSSSTPAVGSSTPQYILIPKVGQWDYSEIKNYIQDEMEK